MTPAVIDIFNTARGGGGGGYTIMGGYNFMGGAIMGKTRYKYTKLRYKYTIDPR